MPAALSRRAALTPNNGMHPTPRHGASHARYAGARVMPGVGLLLIANHMVTKMSLRLSLLVLAFAAPCLGQGRPGGSPQVLEAGNCEINEANLDSIRLDVLPGVGEGESLIIIARLGNGDRRANLNSQRLYAVKEHLSRHGFPADKIVLAEGEKVSGTGRVEFYVAGKLTHVMTAVRNQGFCIECCNPDPADFTRASKKRRRG